MIKWHKGNYYFISPEGYAIGRADDVHGLAATFYVFLKTDKEKIEHEKLVYLNSFDEFSEYEQKILKKLSK